MPLTNAERQARYREKMREEAAKGVRPEFIFRAAKLAYDRDPNPTFPWAALTELVDRDGGAEFWQSYIPKDPLQTYSEYGEDAALMQSVAAVAAIVLFPANQWDLRFLQGNMPES